MCKINGNTRTLIPRIWIVSRPHVFYYHDIEVLCYRPQRKTELLMHLFNLTRASITILPNVTPHIVFCVRKTAQTIVVEDDQATQSAHVIKRGPFSYPVAPVLLQQHVGRNFCFVKHPFQNGRISQVVFEKDRNDLACVSLQEFSYLNQRVQQVCWTTPETRRVTKANVFLSPP